MRAALPALGFPPTRGQADAFGGLWIPQDRQRDWVCNGEVQPSLRYLGGYRGGGQALPWHPTPCPGSWGPCSTLSLSPTLGCSHPPLHFKQWLPALLPCWPPYATLVALSSEIPAISCLHRWERDVSEHILSLLTREERSAGSGPCACSLSRPHGGTGWG